MDLHFVPAGKVVVKDDTRCEILGQFTGAHFPDLQSKPYNIKNIKFDSDVSAKIKFKWPGPNYKGNYRFLLKFCSAFFKKHSSAHAQKLFTKCFRFILNSRQVNEYLWRLGEWGPDFKTKSIWVSLPKPKNFI